MYGNQLALSSAAVPDSARLPMPPALARAAFLAVLLLIAAPSSAQIPVYAEGGYADKHSVAAGGTIAFHIASASSPFKVEIFDVTAPYSVLQTINGLSSSANDCTDDWENGCLWPVTTTFTVPTVWKPGFYAARFPTSRGTRHIFFVVRATSPGAHAPIVILQNSNTDTAYNDFAGKSVYDSRSTNNQRAHIVSFDRPYRDDAGFSRIREWELPFLQWMKSQGLPFEVITDDDMEAEIPLDAYRLFIIVGHSEYWSLKARNHLEEYVANGGNLAIFGGNTMWWQVRVDLETRQMTVYKEAELDPMFGINDEVVTTNFFDWPVFNRENSILGASFQNAGYVNKDPNSSWERLPFEERTPYTVTEADHWVFEGTGLTDGAPFGRSAGAIEVDGAIFNTLPDGDVIVEGSDDTPLNTDILATLPASFGYATMTFFTTPAGGGVFNGAARDWALGLASDTIIQKMTRNVVDRMSNGVAFEYVSPRNTSNRLEDRFNTPVPNEDVLPGWQYDRRGLSLAGGCAVEGPSGLQLASNGWTQVIRSFEGENGVSSLAANLWINADLLEKSATFATPLLEFVDQQGESIAYVAALGIMDFNQTPFVRATAFPPSSPSVSTAWVALPPGWHSVQMAWNASGGIQLNVSGMKVEQFGTAFGQTVNAVMLEYAGSNYMTGSVCVDHLQVRNAFAPASGFASNIAVSPDVVPADGNSTASITVTLFDADGHPLVNGGDAVTLETTRGALSAVIDNGDGTYSATISSTIGGIATISGTVNGDPFSQTATVTFEGDAAALGATAPESVVAGQTFLLTVTARDAEGQTASGYQGTVHFTTNAPDAVLPGDYTFVPADEGVKEFYDVTLGEPGSWTITITDTADSALTTSVTIEAVAATSTVIVSSVNPSYAGQEVTFTATVSSNWEEEYGGTVTFFDGTEPLGADALENGVATFTTSALAQGTHVITAEYSGEGHVLGSVSAELMQTVEAPSFNAPAGFTATAASSGVVSASWQLVEAAVRYDLFRRAAGGGYVLVGSTTSTTFQDNGVAPGSSYFYYVRAVDTSGAVADSAIDVATTVMFSNDPLVARQTVIKAAHIMQLRTAINAFRALTGLPPETFSDPSLEGRRMKTAHVAELRTALAEARGLAGLPVTDPILESGDLMKAVHLQELRDMVK